MKKDEEPRIFETDEEKGARLSKKSPLRFLVDANLTIEGLRVSTQIRQTHLKLRGETDPETDALLLRLQSVEEDMDTQVKRLIEAHPAYPFFSRVKGVGNENISKVVSFIDIEKASTPSSLWKFAGFHVENGKAPKPKPGEKLEFNKKLRTMCWRLANSIVKSGAIHGGSKFYDLFERELKRLNEKYKAAGIKVVPSDDLPVKDGKRYESPGMISLGHVRNQALREDD